MVSLLGGEPFQWSDWESVALRLVQLGLKVSATMADWGVDQLTFNQLGGNDRPSFYPHNRLLETQARTFRNAFPRWKSDLRIRGLDLRGSDGYLHRIECTSRNEAIAIDDCSPAEGFLFVDELGRASPCSFTSDSLGVDIDTLTNATAIFSLTNHWRRQRKQSHPKACDDCHATHVHAKFVQLGSMP